MQVKTPEQKRVGLKDIGNRYSDKRRGNRMNSRVHVRAEWEAEGKTAAAEAFTRVVNPYGCMVILKPSLELNQRLSPIWPPAPVMLRLSSGKGIHVLKAGNTGLNCLLRIWIFGGWNCETAGHYKTICAQFREARTDTSTHFRRAPPRAARAASRPGSPENRR